MRGLVVLKKIWIRRELPDTSNEIRIAGLPYFSVSLEDTIPIIP